MEAAGIGTIRSTRSTKPAANWAERWEPVTQYSQETVVLILSPDARKMSPASSNGCGLYLFQSLVSLAAAALSRSEARPAPAGGWRRYPNYWAPTTSRGVV